MRRHARAALLAALLAAAAATAPATPTDGNTTRESLTCNWINDNLSNEPTLTTNAPPSTPVPPLDAIRPPIDDTYAQTLTNPFRDCYRSMCQKGTRTSVPTDKCMRDTLFEFPDTLSCDAFLCVCRNGGNAWNPENEVCSIDRKLCLSQLKEEMCDTEYRECVAGLVADFINSHLDHHVQKLDDCSHLRQCLEGSTNLITCADAPMKYVPGIHACHMHEHAHGPPSNIIVLTIMMLLGNVCRYFGNLPIMNKLPYTVQVFILGAIWGFICKNWYGGFGKEYGQLGEIDPHLLFFIFLPILIFESAFATHHHVFKEVQWHCIFLATLGLMICSALTAVCAKFIFVKYAWTWVSSLLFGCMLSATDPVAVVALLKELGAEPAISQLIEGESLLNDGTAIVFFGILKDAIAAGRVELSALDIIIQLVKISGGGIVLGFVVGVVVTICIKRVFNDAPIEITLTLVAAYLTFYVAEGFLHVSGVLGLVIMGMYLAFHSHVISPEVEHSLHHFWEIIVYMGNTFIFGIAGLVIAEKAFDDLEAFDWGYLAINYVVLNVVRGLGLMILWVPMNKVGYYQLDWRNAVLCTWGGLRGAVGLALALIIVGEHEITCSSIVSDDPEIIVGNHNIGSRFLFHVAGVVILTLCCNGVLTGCVVNRLQLDAVPTHRKRAMRRLTKEVRTKIEDTIYDLRREPVFRDAKWTQVQDYTITDIEDPHNQESDVIVDQDLQEDACQHYYRVMEKAVEHEYENGTMLGWSIRKVLEQLALCEQQAALGNWGMVEADFLEQSFHVATKDAAMVHAFDLGIGFLNMHYYVQHHIDGVCNAPLATNRVVDHCKRVRRNAIRVIDQFSAKHDSNKEIAVSLKSRNAARDVLNKMRVYVGKQLYAGKVTPADAAIVKGQIERSMKNLRKKAKHLASDEPDTILSHMCGSWYRGDVKTVIQEKIASESDRCLCNNMVKGREGPQEDNKNILGKTKDGMFMLVLLSGVVRVDCGTKTENFGPGYIAGLTSVLTGKLGRYTGVYPESRIEYLKLTTRDVRIWCQQYPAFSAALWDELCRQTARKVLRCEPQYVDWPHVKIKNFAEKGRRQALQPNESYPTNIPGDAICVLVSGEFKDAVGGREQGESPCIIPRHLNAALFTSDSVMFAIANPLTPAERARQRWGKVKNKLFTARAIATLQGHEAGLKAVREVLEGRSVGLFGKAETPQQPALSPSAPNGGGSAGGDSGGGGKPAPAPLTPLQQPSTTPRTAQAAPAFSPRSGGTGSPMPMRHQSPYQRNPLYQQATSSPRGASPYAQGRTASPHVKAELADLKAKLSAMERNGSPQPMSF